MYTDNFSSGNNLNTNSGEGQNSNENLTCSVSSVFGEDALEVYSLTGSEEISECYLFSIAFFSNEENLDPQKAIGSNLELEIRTVDTTRYIHGIVSKFAKGMTFKRNAKTVTQYFAEIRPKLWTLSLNQDCKIFQNKSALDIIKSVLSDSGIVDVTYNVSKCGQSEREYCVQYNESNFNFVSRLMEEEGIFYFFKHEKEKHTLILADSSSAYEIDGSLNDVRYYYMSANDFTDASVFSIQSTAFYGTDSFAFTDYNFELSQTDLLNKATGKTSNFEVFEYPGIYKQKSVGKDLADIRIQEIETNKLVVSGKSTVSNFVPGFKFKLQNHPDDTLNSEYLLCKVSHKLEMSTDSGIRYENSFWAIPSTVEFRPARKTQKVKIFGNQTAVVTGPSGEEIYRDKFGRIKVHFYWDRHDPLDENSSCWVRVAQIWAGNSWGGLFTPRIGHEVVINFENGDPDRPLIVGCVYNDQYMPPYSEEESTKSTVKSSSSKGEDGFNEIRFEDLKDEEEIYIHAQKDMNIDIINQRTTLIEESHDFLTISKGSRTIDINAEGDDTGNLTTTLVRGDITTTIKEGSMITTLENGDETTTLQEGNMTTTLNSGNKEITLDSGNLTCTLSSGDYTESIDSGNKTLTVKGNYTIEIDGNLSITVKGKVDLKANQDINVEGLTITQKAKTDFKAEGGTNLMAKGAVGLTVEGGATLTAKAPNTTVQGQAACTINAPAVTIGGGSVSIG